MSGKNVTEGMVGGPSGEAVVVTLVVYSVSLVVGTATNAVVVVFVCWRKTVHTSSSPYIANMAVFDLLTCTLLVPLRMSFYLQFVGERAAGGAQCLADTVLRVLTDLGRQLFLTSVSYERYRAVVTPFKDKVSASRAAADWSRGLWLVIVAVTGGSSSLCPHSCHRCQRRGRLVQLMNSAGKFSPCDGSQTEIHCKTVSFNLSNDQTSSPKMSPLPLATSVASPLVDEKREDLCQSRSTTIKEHVIRSRMSSSDVQASGHMTRCKTAGSGVQTPDGVTGGELSGKDVGSPDHNACRSESRAASSVLSSTVVSGVPLSPPTLPSAVVSGVPPSLPTLPTAVVSVVEMDGSQHTEMVAWPPNVQGDVCLFTPQNRESGRRRLELRVAKRLAAIFLSYVLLYLPFGCSLLAISLMPDSWAGGRQGLGSTIAVLSSLTCATAAVNPVVYMMANTVLRSAVTARLSALHRLVFRQRRGLCRHHSKERDI